MTNENGRQKSLRAATIACFRKVDKQDEIEERVRSNANYEYKAALERQNLRDRQRQNVLSHQQKKDTKTLVGQMNSFDGIHKIRAIKDGKPWISLSPVNNKEVK